jgi:hypothetical protein
MYRTIRPRRRSLGSKRRSNAASAVSAAGGWTCGRTGRKRPVRQPIGRPGPLERPDAQACPPPCPRNRGRCDDRPEPPPPWVGGQGRPGGPSSGPVEPLRNARISAELENSPARQPHVAERHRWAWRMPVAWLEGSIVIMLSVSFALNILASAPA